MCTAHRFWIETPAVLSELETAPAMTAKGGHLFGEPRFDILLCERTNLASLRIVDIIDCEGRTSAKTAGILGKQQRAAKHFSPFSSCTTSRMVWRPVAGTGFLISSCYAANRAVVHRTLNKSFFVFADIEEKDNGMDGPTIGWALTTRNVVFPDTATTRLDDQAEVLVITLLSTKDEVLVDSRISGSV